jgi:hypothetical protein
MNYVKILLILLPLLACTASAQQLHRPTNADLRAAYCIPVLQADIARLDKAIPAARASSGIDQPIRPYDFDQFAALEAAAEKQRAERFDALNRLQALLLPRMAQLDSTALLAAQARAAADMEEKSKEGKDCVMRCSKTATNDYKALSLCIGGCSQTVLSKRIEACRPPTRSGSDGIGISAPGTYREIPRSREEEIEWMFQRNRDAIREPYVTALRENPQLQGKLVLEVTISPSGDVTMCRVVSTELNDKDLEEKIIARVRLFHVEARDVPPITTTKPFVFFPQ